MADALEVEIKQLYDDWIANPSAVVCARLADRLRLAGRISEALDVAYRGLEEWPANVQINLACARCRRESGESALALECFQKVLTADPLNLVALRAVGEIAYEQQRYDDAERLLGDYLFENPADQDAEKLLAKAREARSASLAPAASPVEEPAGGMETQPSEAPASPPPHEEVLGPVPAAQMTVSSASFEGDGPAPAGAAKEEPPVSCQAEEEPGPEAEPAQAAPSDLPLFTPLIATAEPGEPEALGPGSIPAPSEESRTAIEPEPAAPPLSESPEDILAGAFGIGDIGRGDMPAEGGSPAPLAPDAPGSAPPASPEPPTPASDSSLKAGFDWIRSAAGLDTAPAVSGEPGPHAATDEAAAETPLQATLDVFPRTDRMERIIEAQTPRQAPTAEPSVEAGSATESGAPALEPSAPSPAPSDRQAPERTPAQAQRQAMPRREPRSLLDLFSPEEREELGLEPFKQEEQ